MTIDQLQLESQEWKASQLAATSANGLSTICKNESKEVISDYVACRKTFCRQTMVFEPP